ncbi:MAG: cob(I)yrinic acid a,c-diamide adenosyltransferase [Ignavibacteriae bacterium]|nr:MAG: cob(I)yrinic acid a,c-diamide adenosyltransferase [Ignavibacteriota bacterium]
MRIYTKTGDAGDTSLFGGKRVQKNNLRIEVYGTVDELNAHLGIIRALKPSADVDNLLEQLQNQLFVLGSDLAAPFDTAPANVIRIQEKDIQILEDTIDRVEEQCEPLRSFILPGGAPVSAHLHAARTICRRAERLTDALGRKEDIGKNPLIYLNRLSDLLFVTARAVNTRAGIKETKWNERD